MTLDWIGGQLDMAAPYVLAHGISASTWGEASAPGTYLITGTVTLPSLGGRVVRTAEKQVTVIDAPSTRNSASIQSTGSGCAQTLGVPLDVTVKTAGPHIFRGQLAGPDGTTLALGQYFNLVAGAQTVLPLFSMDTSSRRNWAPPRR